MKFRDKVVLVVGAGPMGRAIIDKFFDDGARLIVFDISSSEGDYLVSKYSDRLKFYCVDVSEHSALTNIIDGFDKVDICIYSVRGKRQYDKETVIDYNAFTEFFDVSFGGCYVVMRSVLQHMQRQNSGIFVVVNSISSVLVSREDISYHVAKASLLQCVRWIAERYGKYGVRANSISLGFINKHSTSNYDNYDDICRLHPLQRVGNVDDIANAVLYLASEDASFLTGQNLLLDGGLTLKDQYYARYCE